MKQFLNLRPLLADGPGLLDDLLVFRKGQSLDAPVGGPLLYQAELHLLQILARYSGWQC